MIDFQKTDINNANSAMSLLPLCDSDLEVSSVIKISRSRLADPEWKKFEDEFSYIADFYTNSSDRYLSEISCRLSFTSQMDKLKQSIVKQYSRAGGLDLEGLELSSSDKSLCCVFLKDATEAGRFRYSVFNQSGFLSHITRDSYKELLNEAFSSGFTRTAKGSLNEFSSDPVFFAYLEAH
jgi:hypothetical protein